MHDDNPILLDHHRHHLPLLLYYLVAAVAGFAGSTLAGAFLSWTGVAGLALLVASAFLSSFFLANFISSLAGAAGAEAVTAGAAGAAGVLAGSVAKAVVVTNVAIRVAIVFI